ncbi:FadR/GntR family transcriptional regulator [Asticcacaulis benevestitus]|uniref:HTH gntR-type domain-containing protein n=1 Tax=Asticcacaulis benevestitus DSM 16100 = ATCC BAA-896 TaxID=1121022 RepID=V4RKJ1_9CAUL|nr:FadR/GntR family transcriptional regulator [Asticcacaulis benevestitus]ESQ91818.1 hypothetical protein ABENE_09300 [Asticcacaulis benevestitus DSM 16100 = ATCC BAA-896]
MTIDNTSVRITRRRPHLAAGVVEILVRDIVQNLYPVGSALPPENILCEQFEVSRTVIREATKALIEKGLVDSQQGRGTIVCETEAWDMLDPMVLSNMFKREDGLIYLDNLIEIRALLEASMAAKAAAKATPEDRQQLIRLRANLEELRDNPAEYLAEDIALHGMIMEISGDKLSAAIIRTIHDQAREAAKYNGRISTGLLNATHLGHLKIVDAILGGDSDAAARAMHEHIESAWSNRRES